MAEGNGRRPREQHQGSVVLRGNAVRDTTADQRLLDSRLRKDWKTKDAWRALRILSEFVEGFDTLADLPVDRSEEHTSELQSRPHLVCRLLLEKKKIKSITVRKHRVRNPYLTH